jgi:hypothetical protein
MNETNRTVIVLVAALWIVLMAIVIFVAWAADAETVDRLDDFVQYLDDHRDSASRLIVTLGALVLIVLALLVIIVELAPEEEGREIRVEQAGATTIVPAEPLRLRLEEALTTMTQVTAARVRVFSQDRGLGTKLELTVAPGANIGVVTQEASRVVVDTLQADLGLSVSAPPTVRILFGSAEATPVASSMSQPPAESPLDAGQSDAERPGEPTLPAAPSTVDPTTDASSEAASPEGERPIGPPPEVAGPAEPPATESPPEDETQQH